MIITGYIQGTGNGQPTIASGTADNNGYVFTVQRNQTYTGDFIVKINQGLLNNYATGIATALGGNNQDYNLTIREVDTRTLRVQIVDLHNNATPVDADFCFTVMGE